MGNDLELQLLNDFQRDFPLTPKPFARIARCIGTDETTLLAMLRRLQENGTVSRVGAVFRPHRVGASTLAALAAPPDRLEGIAARISARPEVNHNYQREHRYNLWFVVAAPDSTRVHQVLDEIETESGCSVLYLPMIEDYHIDLGFDLTGRSTSHSDSGTTAAPPFTPTSGDRRLIAAIQDGLPLVSRPYALVAQRAHMSELQVMARLQAMILGNVIKRFGVVVRHHELGFRANAMAVWDVPDEQVSELGRCLSRYPFITLCYRRRRQLPQWRYNLYCMVHGRDRDTVRAHLQLLGDECGLNAYAHELLFSLRRFKQCGARYAATPAEPAARSA